MALGYAQSGRGATRLLMGLRFGHKKAACTFTTQSAGCFFTLSDRLKTYFTAEFPPSADIAAPVIKLLIGLTKNKIVAAISSGRAMRLTACSPAAHARCCESADIISVSVPPGSYVAASARRPRSMHLPIWVMRQTRAAAWYGVRVGKLAKRTKDRRASMRLKSWQI